MVSKRTVDKARRTAEKALTSDSFQNFVAKMGWGANKLFSGAQYGFNPVSRNRTELEWMYRGSWLVGNAVDVVADDMTRAGIDINSTMDPADIAKMNAAIQRHMIWPRINQTAKWARLYGGAIAVMLIDGQDPATPLRVETVGKGQFKGLLVLDRWMVDPNLQDLVREYGNDLGNPKFYTVTADAPALSRMRIHYSRVLRLEGVELPYWQKISENLWGISVVERLFDRLIAFDSASTGAAQLVYKAYLRTYKIPRLREIIAAGGAMETALRKQLAMIRDFQTNEGLTVIDGEDDFQTHTYTFTGLDSIIMQFGQQLSGALQIPMTRLLGQSPSGLNATGESDMRNYYDGVNQQQELRLRHPLDNVLRVEAASEGIKLPDDFGYMFRPLWQLSAPEKSEVAAQTGGVIGQLEQAGTISRQTALKELRQVSEVTGVFSNITDEEIEAAEVKPPPAPDPAAALLVGGDDVVPPSEEASELQSENDGEEAAPEKE